VRHLLFLLPALVFLTSCNIPLTRPDPNQIAACSYNGDYATVHIGMNEFRMLQCMPNKPYLIRTTVIDGHIIKLYRMNDGRQGVFEVTDGAVSGWTNTP
jgi:hypothetical protein